MIEEIKKAREAMRSAEDSLYANQNRLRTKQSALINANRLGEEGSERAALLQREIAELNQEIERGKSGLRIIKGNVADLVGEFVLPETPRQLISRLDDSLPFLMLPVRIETRFMGSGAGRELWVRVYPDDIAVHTHEKELSRDDADSGVEYLIQRTIAASIPDLAEREQLEKGAWRALVNSLGGTRAAWVISELKKRVIEKEGSENFAFMLIRAEIQNILADKLQSPAQKRTGIISILSSTHPVANSIRERITTLLDADPQIGDATRDAIIQTANDGILIHLGFDLEVLKAESWTRAPRSEVMPDRFVLIGINGDFRLEQPFPTAVVNPLIVGPNPQNLETELSQQAGDLVLGEDFEWIANFDKAIQVGMAIRVPLSEPFASKGFERLLVLGIRVSSTPADHKALLEELIDDHHYSPDGMSFLPQGTPTNHTADQRSGFSSDDAEGEASFETEAKDPVLDLNNDEFSKTDAKRLSEAWDVDLGKLVQLANANRKDVSQARIMNRALWPATLGYYLEEMLQIDAADIGRVRKFFAEHVVARGSLPAIRVGKQPYGILVTSAFRRWQTNRLIDGEEFNFLGQVHQKLSRVEDQWQQLVSQVAHVDSAGDPFVKLLSMLGLHATSVDFQRRIGTHQALLWNVANFGILIGLTGALGTYFNEVTRRGLALLAELGLTFPQVPKLFGLLFNANTSGINGPLIDDVEKAEDEKLSETIGLPAKYRVRVPGEGEGEEEVETFEDRNYIGWLINSDLNTLKQQTFTGPDGPLPIPAALLYRMLHRSLLLSTHDASITVIQQFHQLDNTIRREQDFTNIEAGRTVTRWEFMEADRVALPQLGLGDGVLGDFLLTADVSQVPAAFTLKEVKDSIAGLESLKTAELERLFAEHIDLCSYRLDAWQTALFAARLQRLNLFRENPDAGASKRGVHLGAYGWLENVRPAPALVPVPETQIPPSLRQDGVVVVEQPQNGGYIHSPSINHAVAAAVLRNAYLTHATQSNADHFAVRLTSERVRTALGFIEGVRNGQQLGALLGYQFERALHDRYLIGGEALAQHILAFRKKYPMVADKITPGASATDAINRKESYHVVDGYALLEAVMFGPSPLGYPYGVDPLPAEGTEEANAIIAEVERLKETLDAIADLSLAEGVFQVTQGNYERAGAMLKALSEGTSPPDPEIVNTPRSGAVVNHKLTVHFESGAVTSPWSVEETPRSLAAPGLNKWLGDRIGGPDSVQFSARFENEEETTPILLTQLGLQPIDLIYLIGNQAGAAAGTQEVNDLTELEARIDFAFRRQKPVSPQRVVIEFIRKENFPATARSLFELLPLLRNLRELITTSRPLGADDYTLQSEEKTDPNTAENPKRWELSSIETAFDDAAGSLDRALGVLGDITATFPPNALSKDPAQTGNLDDINYEDLRLALIALSLFGLPGAFPKNALFPELAPDANDEQRLSLLRARQSLIEQGLLTLAEGQSRLSRANDLRNFTGLTPEEVSNLTVSQRVDILQAAGALVLGDSFRFVPTFRFKNLPELQSAHNFSNEVTAEESLLRFTQSRLTAASSSPIADWRDLAVEEWLQGAAAVRDRVRLIDAVNTYQEGFADASLTFKPVQLPFDKKAHWIALEFPEVTPELLDDENSFVPAGDFLSVVRQLPDPYDASAAQSGLLIDEWNEVIPNRVETTGIAIHYNQPNTEPPQCVLVAVSPNVNGSWEWDDLVDTVIDTFDRAKRRAVEPDFLRQTAYWQLLPAILSSFTSYPHGTISTNIAAQPVSLVTD